MNNLPRLPRISIRNWAVACYSCGWFYPVANSSSSSCMHTMICGFSSSDFRVPAAGFQLQLSRVPAAGYKLRLTSSSGYSSSGSWIPVAADSFLRLTLVPAAGYELRLILSCGWLEFRRLDTSCSWLRPTVDSSSSDWVRVTADYILRLTRIPAAPYDLELIHPAADYELWLVLSWHWLEFRRLDSKCSWLIL